MKRIVYTRPDGGVSVIAPAPEFIAEFPTIDDAMQALRLKDVPSDAVDIAIVDTADVPVDREFRNAWVQTNGIVKADMPKARDIHEARITEARRLKARDILERETMGEDITAEKAALQAMNARPQIDAAQTPDALKAVWPAGLPRP